VAGGGGGGGEIRGGGGTRRRRRRKRWKKKTYQLELAAAGLRVVLLDDGAHRLLGHEAPAVDEPRVLLGLVSLAVVVTRRPV
jgi:hypothetical protein